jgi:hypothetical protein
LITKRGAGGNSTRGLRGPGSAILAYKRLMRATSQAEIAM